MDNDSIRRLVEEEEISLREVAFLVALPSKLETFERMMPSGHLLEKTIGKKREFREQMGFYDWEFYASEVSDKVMPMLAALYQETGVAAITDLTFGGFKARALDDKYKWIILAAHHSRAKGQTEFLDGLVDDKKLMDVFTKKPKAKVFELCRFKPVADQLKLDKTYQSVGPTAYALWDIPILEGIFFLTTWVKCLKAYPTISGAYGEAVEQVAGRLFSGKR